MTETPSLGFVQKRLSTSRYWWTSHHSGYDLDPLRIVEGRWGKAESEGGKKSYNLKRAVIEGQGGESLSEQEREEEKKEELCK